MTVHDSMLFSLVCCFIITLSISKTNAEQTSQQFEYFCDSNNDRGNYTANSTYHKNLNTLLSNLNSDTKDDYGFYNSSYGEEPDQVNAIGMCRGDIKPNECRSCLNYAKANLTQLCLYRKEAIGWYQDEICMLRYSNRSIFGLMEEGPAYYKWNSKNASDADQFNQVVKNLLNSLRSKAASSDSGSHQKFSVGTATSPGDGNQTIYGLVQCTPDLSEQDCDNCLVQSIAVIPDCCNNKIGARVVRPSCSFRYETASPFYDASAEAPSPLSPPMLSLPTPSSPQGMNNTSSSAATTVPLLLLLGLFLSVSI